MPAHIDIGGLKLERSTCYPEPRRKAETLVAALSMSTIAESEHVRSEAFDSPESVYRACADLKLFNPYREYLRWIAEQDRIKALAAWQKALAGVEEPTYLASIEPGCSAPIPEQIVHELPEATTEALNRQARRAGLTLNSILQGVWAILLSKLSGQQDVVFGTTVAGRPAEIAGIETMIGLFINTMPVRVGLQPSEPLHKLFSRLQDNQSQLAPYQHLGLSEIQRVAGVDKLFDTLMVFENYPTDQNRVAHPAGGLRLTSVEGNDTTHYPLTLVAVPGERLRLRVQYRPDLFVRSTVESIARRLVRLLEAVITDPNQLTRHLDILDQEERRQVLVNWNATASSTPFTAASSAGRLFLSQIPSGCANVSQADYIMNGSR